MTFNDLLRVFWQRRLLIIVVTLAVIGPAYAATRVVAKEYESTATLAIAKALGARVIVTSSSRDKLDRARELGADATFNHDTDDVAAGVKDVTGGGAHVVVDNVGEATWKRSLDSARPAGRVCVCGATSGPNPPA